MKRANLVAELVGDVDHLRHLVGTIAVVVNEDVAAQHLSERLVAEVARRWIAFVVGVPFVPFAAILLGRDPRGAVARHVSHSRGRAPIRVDAFRVLATGHLESVLGAREFHPLHRAGGNDFEHDAAAADQVRRSRKHLECRHAAGKIARKLRILRPDRMLGPHVRSGWIRRLVAVAVGVDTRRGIDAQMRMDIDDAGCQILARAVDAHGVSGNVDRSGAHGGNLAIRQQHRASLNRRAGGRENCQIKDVCRPTRNRGVRARERVGERRRDGAEPGRRRLRCVGGRGWRGRDRGRRRWRCLCDLNGRPGASNGECDKRGRYGERAMRRCHESD